MTRLKDALIEAVHILTEAGIETPRLDAEVLLAYILQKDRPWLYAHNDASLSIEANRQFKELVQRRMRQEPVAYITGEREFFGLPFYVTPQVLIPRPETELLVELALELIKPESLVVDLGAGSGCLAVSLAVHAPTVRVIATDISAGALAVARQNILRHAVAERITLVQADLLVGIKGPVDLLVSNPPYISEEEMHTLSAGVRNFEPPLALTDQSTGLRVIERILKSASTRIKSGGVLLIEFGASQGQQALTLARAYSSQADFQIKKDLAGRDRVLVGYFS